MNNEDLKGWLAIYSFLMNQDNQYIQDFINEHKSQLAGYADGLWKRKADVIYYILVECITDIELRKALQQWFGQFDGAQICMNCGKVMWKGYSWDSKSYCSIDCIMDGENLTLSKIEEYLKDADDPDGNYYYTEW